MIEAPLWDIKRDETVHKVVGTAHLRKYGQFFDSLANKSCKDNSTLEHVIEGPIRLVYRINEDISILMLAQTENKYFSKLLASVGGTCREVSLSYIC